MLKMDVTCAGVHLGPASELGGSNPECVTTAGQFKRLK